MKDYYSILGISSSATQKEIRSAYINKVKQNHPDLFQHPKEKLAATKKLQDLNEAYEILSNLQTREQFDAQDKDEIIVPGTIVPESSVTNDQPGWGWRIYTLCFVFGVIWSYFITDQCFLQSTLPYPDCLSFAFEQTFPWFFGFLGILFWLWIDDADSDDNIAAFLLDYAGNVWKDLKEDPKGFRSMFMFNLWSVIAGVLGALGVYGSLLVLDAELGWVVSIFGVLLLLTSLVLLIFGPFCLFCIIMDITTFILYWVWSHRVLRKTQSLMVKAKS